ncbi:sigma-70 family RNA polymerase sigma factor [candidate division KSB1 bacterium]|nr:sigma-70 family RNA polymerase sigma factor [candidate division KSB1 bacterium]
MIKFNPVEDRQCIEAYQQGNSDALNKLIKKYYIYIYKVLCYKGVCSDEAEDVTQDICIRLMDSLMDFKHECAFKTYLDRIINNKVIDCYRQSKKARTYSLFALLFSEMGEEINRHIVDDVNFAEMPDQNMFAHELNEIAKKCLQGIRNKMMRQLVQLWLEGFKRRQMAELHDVTMGYVNGTLERGKNIFRDCVRNKWDYFENYSGA